MGEITVRGLVIGERSQGESNKYITLITEEQGRIALLARGAKKPKSKLLAGTQLFCYGDFYYSDRGSFKILNQVDIIESFYEIRYDIDLLAYSSFICEAMSKLSMSDTDTRDLYYLGLYSIYNLKIGRVNKRLVMCIFKLKLLSILGFMDRNLCCSICGESEVFAFIKKNNVFLCENCIEDSKNGEVLLKGTKKSLNSIFSNNLREAFGFNCSSEVLNQLINISEYEFKLHINIDFKSDLFLV